MKNFPHEIIPGCYFIFHYKAFLLLEKCLKEEKMGKNINSYGKIEMKISPWLCMNAQMNAFREEKKKMPVESSTRK